ncbi:MAG: hypothetical protein IK117_12420 [Bacteroidales bacterium]|nr:hypothetical protein [Bacteroidales bacterium]
MADEITKHSMVDDYPYVTYSFEKDSTIRKPLSVEIDSEDVATTNFTYNQLQSIFNSGIAPIVKVNANGQLLSSVVFETLYESDSQKYIVTFFLLNDMYVVMADDPDERLGDQTLV